MFNRSLKKELSKVKEDLRELKDVILNEMKKQARYERGDVVCYAYEEFIPMMGPFNRQGVSVISSVTFRNGKLSYHLENGAVIPEDKANRMCCKEKK